MSAARGRRGPAHGPDERRWRVTLMAGGVVLVAVWGLLEGLRRAVLEVERAVEAVWTAGKGLAQQTQAAHLLQTTKARTAALREELVTREERTEERA